MASDNPFSAALDRRVGAEISEEKKKQVLESCRAAGRAKAKEDFEEIKRQLLRKLANPNLRFYSHPYVRPQEFCELSGPSHWFDDGYIEALRELIGDARIRVSVMYITYFWRIQFEWD